MKTLNLTITIDNFDLTDLVKIEALIETALKNYPNKRTNYTLNEPFVLTPPPPLPSIK